MKTAILESFFLLLFSLMCGGSFFLMECPDWLQWSFLGVMVGPTLWFIPQRILSEME